jgi:hypothetical protein
MGKRPNWLICRPSLRRQMPGFGKNNSVRAKEKINQKTKSGCKAAFILSSDL